MKTIIETLSANFKVKGETNIPNATGTVLEFENNDTKQVVTLSYRLRFGAMMLDSNDIYCRVQLCFNNMVLACDDLVLTEEINEFRRWLINQSEEVDRNKRDHGRSERSAFHELRNS